MAAAGSVDWIRAFGEEGGETAGDLVEELTPDTPEITELSFGTNLVVFSVIDRSNPS